MSAAPSGSIELGTEKPEATPEVFATQDATPSSKPRFKTVKRPATYMEAMKKLSEELPYIAYTNIQSEMNAPKNPKAATITVIDTPKHRGTSMPRVYHLHDYPSKYPKDASGRVQQSESESELSEDTIANELKGGSIDNILYRIIMVEEINGRAINLLGKAFPTSIDPDLLVEHLALQRHREQRFERAQKFIPRRKGYISLQWSRVFVHHDGRKPAECGSGGGGAGSGDSSTMVLRNTVPRPFSRLWIADGPKNTMEGTGDPGDPAFEDSAMGNSTAGGPMIGNRGGNTTMGEEPPTARPGVRNPLPRKPSPVPENLTLGSSTSGRLTPAASTPGGSTPREPKAGVLNLQPGDLAVAPTRLKEGEQATSERGEVHAHYECASVCWLRNDNEYTTAYACGPFATVIVLLLLDPLPEPQAPDYKIISYDHCRGEWDSKPRNAPELPVGEAEVTQLEEDDPEEWEGFQPRAKITKLDNWQPSGSANANLPLPSDKRSTAETLKRDLESAEVQEKYNKMGLKHGSEMVARLLFRIIERDSYMLLTTISEGLHGIQNTMHISDDIHQHMALWQDLFVKYREHVFCIRRCMSNLINCLKALDGDSTTDVYSLVITRHPGHKSQKLHTCTPTTKDSEFYDDLISLLEQVEAVYLEIQETSNSLISIISIIESERAIDEAEGISKLTELAFFFIPLGFSSTLFGMQVKEINGNSQVSIYTWIITACCIVFASYALRLAVRSRFVRKTKEKMIAEVRYASGINKKTTVPLLTFVGHQTTKLISWGFPDDPTSVVPQQHTLAGFFVVVCVLIVLATALIWIVKSSLPQLVKIVLTCGFNIPWVFIMCGSTAYRHTKIAGLDSRIQWSTNRSTTGLLGKPRVQTQTFSDQSAPPHMSTWQMPNTNRPMLRLSQLLDGGRENYS